MSTQFPHDCGTAKYAEFAIAAAAIQDTTVICPGTLLS
jgi:hypothetical protein